MSDGYVFCDKLFNALEPQQLYAPNTFFACYNERGLYHSAQFVLRLSPVVHGLVDSITSKTEGQEITYEEISAYATFIHENVHWWQHVGSTVGLILSLGYPAQTHESIKSLLHLAKSREVSKSIRSWSERGFTPGNGLDDDIKHANIVINNAKDFEFFRALVIQPENIREILGDPYFLSVDHSFSMAYQLVVGLLKATFDPEGNYLPGIDSWNEGFTELANEKSGEVNREKTVALYQITGLDILEGQARLIQLQFLCLSHASSPNFGEAAQDGYLKGVYGKAFEYFLSKVGCECPVSVEDPLIAIFLLICDISLNSGVGLPFEIVDFDRFIYDADPKYRFVMLCGAAAFELESLSEIIMGYTREEYIEAARVLTSLCDYNHPLEISEQIADWALTQENIVQLLSEREEFKFARENMLVRVVFSSFVAFNVDKFKEPQFFCWAGYHLAKSSDREKDKQLWLKNLSLFTDKEDDNGIFVRDFPGKSPEIIHETYSQFYASCITYDMTRQWTFSDRPFNYDYSWLTEQHAPADMKKEVKRIFKELYGIGPDDIKCNYVGKDSSSSSL